MSFARWTRIVVSVLGAAALSCAHYQNEGTYALTAVDIVQDQCGLLTTPESLPDGQLIINGQAVRFLSQLDAIELRGKFRENSQSFYADGSAGIVQGTVNGQSCLFDLVSQHLEAATDPTDFNVFTGTMRIEFQTRNNDACSCVVETSYAAQRTGP